MNQPIRNHWIPPVLNLVESKRLTAKEGCSLIDELESILERSLVEVESTICKHIKMEGGK